MTRILRLPPHKKLWCGGLLAIFLFLFLPFSLSQAAFKARPKLVIFYSAGCHKCIEVKNNLMPQIEKKYKNEILIEYRELGQIDNYKLLLALEEKYGARIKNTPPVIYAAGRFLNGDEVTEKSIEAMVSRALETPIQVDEPIKQANLLERFKSFSPWVVLGAGLVDGVNPCAFTVIVFFISFLALQGYKKRELSIVGLTFIIAVFLTYILIGLGIFGFLYRLKSFWLIYRGLNFAIALLSIALGFCALCDLLKFKKTRSSEGLILQLPKTIKDRIQRIVGMYYRKSRDSREELRKKTFFKLILSALAVGFLVSLLEAVCTGQTYLPTISFILKTAPLKLQALSFLILYNFMFIVPLLVIFLFALSGATSGDFAAFLKKHLVSVKLLMAILFFGLGFFLLWRV